MALNKIKYIDKLDRAFFVWDEDMKRNVRVLNGFAISNDSFCYSSSVAKNKSFNLKTMIFYICHHKNNKIEFEWIC